MHTCILTFIEFCRLMHYNFRNDIHDIGPVQTLNISDL